MANYTVTYFAGNYAEGGDGDGRGRDQGVRHDGPGALGDDADGFRRAGHRWRARGRLARTWAPTTAATATGGNVANYTVTYFAGNFSITPKAVTVTAGGGTKVYGTADPTLSVATQTGVLAGDISGIVLAVSTREALEAVGDYGQR